MPRFPLILLVPLLLLGSACQATRNEGGHVRQAGEGEVAVYLQPLPAAFADLRLELAGCALVGRDGRAHPLRLVLPAVTATEAGRQRLLAAGSLPAGEFQGIALTVARADLAGRHGHSDLVVQDAPLLADLPLTIGPGEGRLVTLAFQTAAVPGEAVIFAPGLAATIPDLPPLDLFGYAGNAADHSLTVYDKKAGEARALIALAERPAGLALDARRQRLFVALPEHDAIQVVDVRTGQQLERIPLNLGDAPRDLALTPGETTLLAVNRGSRTLSFIDPESYVETARVPLGNRPGDLLVDAKGTFAFVVNEHDNTVSVVSLASQRQAALLSTESSPIQVALSRDGGRLFVAHAWSPYLLVYDVATLTRRRSVHVGLGVSAIKVDQRTDQLYVARAGSPVIDIFDTFSYLPVNFIEADGGVTRMAIDDEENSLVLLLPRLRRLQTVNLVSRKPVLRVDLGADPARFVQAGER